MITKGVSPRRIFFVDPSLFAIGYDDHLLEAMLKQDDQLEVHFFARRPRQNERNMALSQKFGSRFVEHRFFYRWSERLRSQLPSVLFQILKLAEHKFNFLRLLLLAVQLRPTAIYLQWLLVPFLDGPFVWALRFFSKARLIFTLHDSTPFQGSPASRLQTLFYFKVIPLFDRVVVHTQTAKDLLVQNHKILSSNVTICPHGDLKLVLDSNSQSHLSLEPLMLQKLLSKPFILQFGNLRIYKGIDDLVVACKSLFETRQDFNLVIAGQKLDVFAEAEGVFTESAPQPASDSMSDSMSDRSIIVLNRYLSENDLHWLLEQCSLIVFPYHHIDASGALALAKGYNKWIVASELLGFQMALESYSKKIMYSLHGVPADTTDATSRRRALTQAIEIGLKKTFSNKQQDQQFSSTQKDPGKDNDLWKTSALQHLNLSL